MVGYDETTADVITLVSQLLARCSRDLEVAGSAHDLTVTQVKALLVLTEPVPMRELAARLRAEPSNVTAVVDRLERLQLAERQPVPGDRRVRTVVATRAGRALAARLRHDAAFSADPLRALDQAERAQLRDLLQRVLIS